MVPLLPFSLNLRNSPISLQNQLHPLHGLFSNAHTNSRTNGRFYPWLPQHCDTRLAVAVFHTRSISQTVLSKRLNDEFNEQNSFTASTTDIRRHSPVRLERLAQTYTILWWLSWLPSRGQLAVGHSVAWLHRRGAKIVSESKCAVR